MFLEIGCSVLVILVLVLVYFYKKKSDEFDAVSANLRKETAELVKTTAELAALTSKQGATEIQVASLTAALNAKISQLNDATLLQGLTKAELDLKIAELNTTTSQLNDLTARQRLTESQLSSLTTQQGLTQSELTIKTAELNAQVDMVRKLTNDLKGVNDKLAKESADLVKARKAMYEADDYILQYYTKDNEHVKMLRRVRDVLLLLIQEGRKAACTGATSIITPYVDLLKSGQLATTYSKGFPTYPMEPQMYQLPNCVPTPIVDIIKQQTQTAGLIDVVDVTKMANAKCNDMVRYNTDMAKYQTDMAKYQTDMATYQLAATYFDAGKMVCDPNRSTNQLQLILNQMRSELSNNPKKFGGLTSVFKKENLLELIDALEVVIFQILKSTCDGRGGLDTQKVIKIADNFLKLLCVDDPMVQSILSKPIDLILVKTFNMFTQV
jgi:hypothetical protein